MLGLFAGGPSPLCAFGLGCEAPCWALCLWGQAGSQVRGSGGAPWCFRAQNRVCLPSPGSQAGNTRRCHVCVAVQVSREG